MIYDASNEIRGSMVFATVIICLVFVPLLFLEGLEGRFFRPLGIAYITSILASLLVALTVTPALCRLLFRRAFAKAAAGVAEAKGHGDGMLVRLIKRVYEPLLQQAMRHRIVVLGGSGVLAAGALLLASTFGTSFLPTFREGTYTVFLMAPPGTSLGESDRLARGVESRLIEIEGAASVTRRTGRAERDEHAEPVSFSEIEVTVAPDGDYETGPRADRRGACGRAGHHHDGRAADRASHVAPALGNARRDRDRRLRRRSRRAADGREADRGGAAFDSRNPRRRRQSRDHGRVGADPLPRRGSRLRGPHARRRRHAGSPGA